MDFITVQIQIAQPAPVKAIPIDTVQWNVGASGSQLSFFTDLGFYF